MNVKIVLKNIPRVTRFLLELLTTLKRELLILKIKFLCLQELILDFTITLECDLIQPHFIPQEYYYLHTPNADCLYDVLILTVITLYFNIGID